MAHLCNENIILQAKILGNIILLIHEIRKNNNQTLDNGPFAIAQKANLIIRLIYVQKIISMLMIFFNWKNVGDTPEQSNGLCGIFPSVLQWNQVDKQSDTTNILASDSNALHAFCEWMLEADTKSHQAKRITPFQ